MGGHLWVCLQSEYQYQALKIYIIERHQMFQHAITCCIELFCHAIFIPYTNLELPSWCIICQ